VTTPPTSLTRNHATARTCRGRGFGALPRTTRTSANQGEPTSGFALSRMGAHGADVACGPLRNLRMDGCMERCPGPQADTAGLRGLTGNGFYGGRLRAPGAPPPFLTTLPQRRVRVVRNGGGEIGSKGKESEVTIGETKKQESGVSG